MTLGVLRPPGDFGVDICVGEGQTLGNRLDFGGPSFGFFAAQEAYLRRMPGRIAGETTDVDGRRGFVLTLQTREQHIRREKATPNICTAQALNALAGMVYLSWLGREGIVELGELLRPAHALRARDARGARRRDARCTSSPSCASSRSSSTRDVDDVIERCAGRGRQPRATRSAPTNGLLVAITEQRSASRHRPTARPSVPRAAPWPARMQLRPHREPPARRPGIEGHDPHPRRSALVETDMQRDRATTIYEKSAPAAARSSRPSSTCPSADELPDAAPPHRAAEAAGGRRAGDRPPLQPALQAQLRPRHGLLPARLVHDEAQPEAARARRGAAGQRPAAPAAGPRARPGRAGADVRAAGRAGRGRRPAARLAAAVAPARTASSPACC